MVSDSLIPSRLDRRMTRFQERYGERVLQFAEYAAFPLALTSELAYCLRERFTPHLPWVVVPQLLLSSISESIGYDLYELDTPMRNALRLRLVERFTELEQEVKLNEIADFLGRYIWSKLRQESTRRMKDLGYPPQWIALACLKTADEVAKAIEQQLVYMIANEPDPRDRLKLVTMINDQSDLLAQRGFEPFDLQTIRQSLIHNQPINQEVAFHESLIELGFPPLQILQYDDVKLVSSDGSQGDQLQKLSFQTVKVNKKGTIVDRPNCEAFYFEESLGDDISPLKMIAIPSGRFLMGSPETEAQRSDSESPQHWVTVPPFFISQTQITQAQWRFIAQQPKIEIELETDPRFKGDRLPIERVSWFEVVEFCQRLSAYTRRDEYRLPTEAEWEYACRAGSTTPFAFGETLSSELATYDASKNYGAGPTGEYQGRSTKVGSFFPNAFGLFDMHGNVWEWCQDHWHDNYQGAPDDGSAWITDRDSGRRIQRGGSWSNNPALCRSARRSLVNPRNRINSSGFRVVCAVPRTS